MLKLKDFWRKKMSLKAKVKEVRKLHYEGRRLGKTDVQYLLDYIGQLRKELRSINKGMSTHSEMSRLLVAENILLHKERDEWARKATEPNIPLRLVPKTILDMIFKRNKS